MDEILRRKNKPPKRCEPSIRIQIRLEKPSNSVYTDVDFRQLCESLNIFKEDEVDGEATDGRRFGDETFNADLMAKGIGYDANDKFIDDTYVNVPAEDTSCRVPYHRGYFVNVGIIKEKIIPATKVANEETEQNDSDSESSSSASEPPEPKRTEPNRMVGRAPFGAADRTLPFPDGEDTSSDNEENNKPPSGNDKTEPVTEKHEQPSDPVKTKRKRKKEDTEPVEKLKRATDESHEIPVESPKPKTPAQRMVGRAPYSRGSSTRNITTTQNARSMTDTAAAVNPDNHSGPQLSQIFQSMQMNQDSTNSPGSSKQPFTKQNN